MITEDINNVRSVRIGFTGKPFPITGKVATEKRRVAMAKHRLVFRKLRQNTKTGCVSAEMDLMDRYILEYVFAPEEWRTLKRIAADSNGRIVVEEKK